MNHEKVITFDYVMKHLEKGTAPFDFPSRKDCRSALKQLQKHYDAALGNRGLHGVPVTTAAIDEIVKRIGKTPPTSSKERTKRKNIETRLRKLAKIVSDAPTWCPEWEALITTVTELAEAQGLLEEKLIPLRNTLRRAALEDGLAPCQMTKPWLTSRMQSAIQTRRESLRDAAHLFDRFHAYLPPQLRPPELFGDLSDTGGGQRRSAALPAGVDRGLKNYLQNRMAGITAEGLRQDCPVSLGKKLKPGGTVIYVQSLKWEMDSLRLGGTFETERMPERLEDVARLDWLAKVGFQAIDDHTRFEEGEPTFLPWDPIVPKTIQNRMITLNRIYTDIRSDYSKQTVPKKMADGTIEAMTSTEVMRLINDWVNGESMTSRQRDSCLALIRDPDRQRLLLNMHTLCWRDAQAVWARWGNLDSAEKRDAIKLCALAAILAIVVHYPLRAGTVTQLTINGRRPDVLLPKRTGTIEFTISGTRMKNRENFDAILEDDAQSQPRKILDWFIAGPREMLLNDPDLLAEKDRDPDRLFGGISVAQYGKVLSYWTEEQGMRMTTHGFRHRIATVLVNVCGTSLEDVARMLGNNSKDIVARHYVFLDKIRRRAGTLAQIATHRRHLEDTKHPRRRMK